MTDDPRKLLALLAAPIYAARLGAYCLVPKRQDDWNEHRDEALRISLLDALELWQQAAAIWDETYRPTGEQ